MSEYDRDKEDFFAGLRSYVEQVRDRREKARFNPADKSQNLASDTVLSQDVMTAKGGSVSPDITPPTESIPHQTEKINTKEVVKVIKGDPYEKPKNLTMTPIDEYKKKMQNLDIEQRLKSALKQAEKAGDEGTVKKLTTALLKHTSKGLKALPVVGGIASALLSEDASAAVPVFGSSEALGPAKGSIEERLESGTLTEQDKSDLKKQAAERLGAKYRNGGFRG